MSDVAMNSERKGERVFLQIIANLRAKGYSLNGVIIGDGTKRKEFEQLTKELKIDEYVEFTGLLSSSEEVMKKLANADIYVFPTVAEGLPRGVLEAMAIGLPVVTSPVGGIPEVINVNQLAEPNDVERYTLIVEELIKCPELMNRISRENFEKAQEYRNELLQKRRDEFYRKLLDLIR
jgi:glycosyltransferase involved in cell wall biosynthesis